MHKGKNNPMWKGGRKIAEGYILIHRPDHPRSNGEGYVFEHILVIEKALGKLPPLGSETHHVNGIRSDNRPENLVLCQDRAYHQFLHQRQRAYDACGYSHWLKCRYCKQYDDPKNLKLFKPNGGYHKKCINAYSRERWAKGKGFRSIKYEQNRRKNPLNHEMLEIIKNRLSKSS